MTRPKNSPPRSPRGGFSLVLSLTLMAMLLLLCISAAALLAVELRVSRATVSHAKARLNAIAAARVALGQLQLFAGNDRRITAPATILDGDIKNIKQPWLTGVWRGRSVGSAYKDAHDNAMVGWLTSGIPFESNPKRTVEYPKSSALNRSAIKMLSAPARATVDKGRAELSYHADAEVFATPEPLAEAQGGSSGSIAWWIGDENLKANLSLRLPKAPPSPAESLAMAQNASRLGLKAEGDGAFAQFPETLPFSASTVSRESLAFDREPGAASGEFWLKDPHNYYHDITPYSESLLTDVVNGGFKYDLSLMLALAKLPDGYRDGSQFAPFPRDIENGLPAGLKLTPAPVGLESKVAGAGDFAKAKGAWMKGTPAEALDPATLPNLNKLEWTCWADVWSYARLYRHPAFDAQSGMKMVGCPEAMGGIFHNGVQQNDTQSDLDRTRVNSVDVQNLAPWREPVITQFQLSVALRLNYPLIAPNVRSDKAELYMVVRPFLQIWNPYNVPLRFTGNWHDSILARFMSLPGKVTLTTNDSTAGSKNYAWNSWSSMVGDTYSIINSFVDFSKEAPLAPGEVRVYSPPSPLIVLRGFSTANEDASIRVSPGRRPFGGYQFKLPVTPFDGNVRVALEPNDGPAAVPYGMAPDAAHPPHLLIDWMRCGNGTWGQTVSGGRGVKADWNGTPDAIVKIDSRAVDATPEQMWGPNYLSQPFARITMRLRSESNSTQKFPVFAHGDPLRGVYHPKPAGSCQNNPETHVSPYEFFHARITSEEDSSPDNPVMECDPATNRGYAFTGYTLEDGINAMVYSHMPLAPLGSLGELRDARLGGGVAYTRLLQSVWANTSCLMSGGRSVVQDAFGNSFAHPMISPDGITKPSALSGPVPESYYDFSWIMNASLWDAYCLTGFAAEDSKLYPGRKLGAMADDFLAGKGLPNKRLIFHDYGVGTAALKELLLKGEAPADEAFAKAPAMMTVNGGFNINSTSVRAWRALLAGLNGASLPVTSTTVPLSLSSAGTKVDSASAALRSPIQSGPLAEVNTGASDKAFNTSRALAGRKLSEEQITELAQKIVEQVKLRGPFLSLGEFMNRRLDAGDLGEKGAIQSAIDATTINAFAKAFPVAQISTGNAQSAGLLNPTAVAGSQARGMPGVVCQADIVSPLATALTARSDTFTIRACGTSDDGAVAYVEMVVRRDAGYLDSTDAPFVLPDKITKIANKAFGRRFKLVLARWLTPENI